MGFYKDCGYTLYKDRRTLSKKKDSNLIRHYEDVMLPDMDDTKMLRV